MAYRHRLGLDETTPLIGIFGFLKPYKRIAESLRAFRRLVRLVPTAKMILVGEAASRVSGERDDPLAWAFEPTCACWASRRSRISWAIWPRATSCSICGIPTVGESSGTLLRSLGLGKAVMVSEIGSFHGISGRCVPQGAGGRGRRGH